MAEREDIRDEVAEELREFNAEWHGFTDIDLLKFDEEADEYETLYTITGEWFFENAKQVSSFREDAGEHKNVWLVVFDESAEMAEAMKSVTHVSINGRERIINRGDSKDPKEANLPAWKLLLDPKFI
jgi:hypothetical protein